VQTAQRQRLRSRLWGCCSQFRTSRRCTVTRSQAEQGRSARDNYFATYVSLATARACVLSTHIELQHLSSMCPSTEAAHHASLQLGTSFSAARNSNTSEGPSMRLQGLSVWQGQRRGYAPCRSPSGRTPRAPSTGLCRMPAQGSRTWARPSHRRHRGTSPRAFPLPRPPLMCSTSQGAPGPGRRGPPCPPLQSVLPALQATGRELVQQKTKGRKHPQPVHNEGLASRA